MRKWKEIQQGVNMDFSVQNPDNNMYLFECTATVQDTHLTATVFRDGVVLNKIGALLTNAEDIENFLNLQATLLVTIEGMIEKFTELKDKQAVDKIKARSDYAEKY